MKRLSLAIIFACYSLAMAAQDGIEVRFLGTSPDIIDFAWSFVTYRKGHHCHTLGQKWEEGREDAEMER